MHERQTSMVKAIDERPSIGVKLPFTMAEEIKGFRVNDRRRFDESGNEREGGNESVQQIKPPVDLSSKSTSTTESDTSRASGDASSRSSSKAAAQSPADFIMRDPKPSSGPDSDPSTPSLSFSSFLMSLATQALIQMGEIEPPGGITLPPDFEAAKQSIEIMGMLAIKTKGNLDPEEQRLFSEVLHSVRLAFVQRVKSAMAASAAAPGARHPNAK